MTDDRLLTLAEGLKHAAEPFWSRACGHRFTRELAAGTLDAAAFGRYLVQDFAFIDGLARLLGYAVAHAPAMPQKTRLAGFLAALTSEENDYFLRSFAALGIAPPAREAITLWPVTQGLQTMMLEAGRSGSFAQALAVLLPAEWIYLTWAQAVASQKPEQFYFAEWIALHRLPEFEAFVTWLREELGRQAQGLSEADQAQLSTLFRRVAEYEVAFFEAAYELP